MDKKSFLEMNKGAILERFDYELARVFDNIMDPNTPATKPRKLQITVEFKADSDRVQVNHSAVVKSTLQPTNPISGTMAVVETNTGMQLVEMLLQIPGQLSMNGAEQDEPSVIEFRKQA